MVKPTGASCPAGASRILPSTATNLISLGVYKQTVANQVPDWGLIIGKIHSDQAAWGDTHPFVSLYSDTLLYQSATQYLNIIGKIHTDQAA